MQAAISRVGPAELPSFLDLIAAIAVEENAGLSSAGGNARAGALASLERFDFARSDSCWFLLASAGSAPAGYASVVRIPKADARAGFLYVDELYVLRDYRRLGVATALLDKVESEARVSGLAGVRLLVRPQNTAARALYRRAGFAEWQSIFCEKRID